jgi:hypothetical protein
VSSRPTSAISIALPYANPGVPWQMLRSARWVSQLRTMQTVERIGHGRCRRHPRARTIPLTSLSFLRDKDAN